MLNMSHKLQLMTPMGFASYASVSVNRGEGARDDVVPLPECMERKREGEGRGGGIKLCWHVVELMNIHAEGPPRPIHSCS